MKPRPFALLAIALIDSGTSLAGETVPRPEGKYGYYEYNGQQIGLTVETSAIVLSTNGHMVGDLLAGSGLDATSIVAIAEGRDYYCVLATPFASTSDAYDRIQGFIDTDIWSTDLSQQFGVRSTDYFNHNGTSYAAPISAGVAALIIASDPSLTSRTEGCDAYVLLGSPNPVFLNTTSPSNGDGSVGLSIPIGTTGLQGAFQVFFPWPSSTCVPSSSGYSSSNGLLLTIQ